MVVYWIRNKTHTNILNEGYVGVSNDLERRYREHRTKPNKNIREALKQGEELLMYPVFEGDERYCLMIETLLRPECNIGWNRNVGGGMPPDLTGSKKSDETKKLHSLNNVGMTGKKHTEQTKRMYSLMRKGKQTGDENSSKRPEVRTKISETRKRLFREGKLQPNRGRSEPCIVNGVHYNSIKEAIKATGLTRYMINKLTHTTT